MKPKNVMLVSLVSTLLLGDVGAVQPQGNQVELWTAATQGGNLAQGKEVWFSHRPNYTTFTKDGFEEKLTDGILSSRANGEIWFSKETVGWKSGADQGIDMMIDLGAPQPIGQIVGRFLGGAKQHTLVYPRELKVLVSNDGVNFYEADAKVKVNAGEKELAESDPENCYYFPEEGVAFVEPMALSVKATARYVVLRAVGGSSWLFLDEIAVLRDEEGKAQRNLEALPKAFFFKDGVSVGPRAGELVITTNVATPNYLAVRDVRSKRNPDKPIEIDLNLPEGVKLLRTSEGLERSTDAPQGRSVYRLTTKVSKYNLIGPLYFGLEENAQVGEGATARFSWIDDDQLHNTINAPVKAVAIPEVPASAVALNASLAWMGNGEAREWPDFFNTYRKLGFSIVPVFPHFWKDDAPPSELVGSARKEGFRIIMNDSPFHRLIARRKEQPEIYNTVGGKQGKHLCPVYAGPYYKEEIQRVANLAQRCAPDFVFYDIETWQEGTAEATDCSICKEAFAQSGIDDWATFMAAQGTRMMKDLHAATAGSAPGGKDPVTGLYNTKAAPAIYHTVFDFRQLYPEFIDLAQPSLYVQGNPERVGDSIRQNYDKMQNREIVPYLTAGTYGGFAPYKMEQMILESYLNGAGGITYYAFRDFDAMAFYYHATALAKLAPYVDLLTKGKRIEVQCVDPMLRCSAFGDEKEALVLVGNYQSASPALASLKLPKEIASAVDASKENELQPISLERLEIPANGHRLIYVRFQ